MKLLCRPELIPGMGPQGYLNYLGYRNGYSAIVLRQGNIRFSVESLEERVGTLESPVKQYVDRIRNLRMGRFDLYQTQFRRICPLCAAEGKVHDVVKELLFSFVCHEHSINLFDHCPQCDAMLEWNPEHYFSCQKCSAPFAAFQSQVCTAEERVLTTAMHKAAEYGVSSLGPFDKLNIEDWANLIFFLSRAYTNRRLYIVKEILRNPLPQDNERLFPHEAFKVAAQMLGSWPQSLFELLDSRQLDVRRSKPLTFKSLGYLYGGMYQTPMTSPVFRPLRDQLEEFVATQWLGAVAGRNQRMPVSAIKRAHSNWVDATSARKRLGIRREKVHELLLAGHLEGAAQIHPSSGRNAIQISEESLRKYEIEVSEWLSFNAANSALGLKSRVINEIYQTLSDLMFPTNCPGKLLNSQVDLILSRFPAAKIPKRHHEQISVRAMLQAWRWSTTRMAHFLHAFITGRIDAVGTQVGLAGLSSLVFRRDEVHRISPDPESPPDLLSINELAVRLGRKQQVIYHLVNAGAIATIQRIHNGRKQEWVKADDLPDLRKAFVFITDYCRRGGSNSLVNKLLEIGFVPDFGPNYDGCRQLIYKRSSKLIAALTKMNRVSKLSARL